MTWTVEFDDAATIELRKLDKQAQQEILRYFRERIATDEDPRRFAKPPSRDDASYTAPIVGCPVVLSVCRAEIKVL